jgi:hypothetical protein
MTAVNVDGHETLNEGDFPRVRYRSHRMNISSNLQGLVQGLRVRTQIVRRIGLACCAGALLASAAGCIVVPAGRHGYGGGGGPVYVEPAYASPGPGWAWEAHPSYGYGWHHPDRGWHRGWR